ncbi:tetratricopeptide repeat protein [Odoribacter sp. OttesenSCG-928-L07]|nr:tetratricopeptide repeat protein [Odoribacter sp. OttesenSCG-928-L07]MDL2240389.1 tetratricopeptide repeat protein [Bacteroidales bacterium OttesenSCG-928-K22]
MKKLFLILVVVFCALFSWAQNVEFDAQNFPDKKVRKEALQLIKKGDKCFYAKTPDYNEALNYYSKVYEINPKNAELNYKMGKCILSKNKKDGLKYFSSANLLFKDSKSNLNLIQENMLLYAKSLQYNYKFDSAAVMYNNWILLIKNNKVHKHEDLELIENFIKQCASGDSLMKTPTRYVVNKLGKSINSEYDDFAPVVYFDTLAFNSIRPTPKSKAKKDKTISNVYASIRRDENHFSDARYLGEPFSTSKNEIITDISSNGKYALISREGDIYYSVHGSDGKWSKMTYVEGELNTDYDERYACFSKDMQYIYFSSDSPNGYGGYDIYRSDLIFTRSGELRCTNKRNLGENINSKFDEISVSFSNFDNNMYVSSNCDKAMGGFDIFKSYPESNSWSPLINMGYPLNSTDDDMYFVRSNNSSTGYFTKSDEHYGTNIYSVDIIDVENIVLTREFDNKLRQTSSIEDNLVFGFEDEIKISSYVMCMVKGFIRDAEDFSPLALRVDVIDNKTLNVVASFETNPSNGMYSISLPSGVSYGLMLKDSIYLFCPQEITIPGTSVYKIIEEDIYIPKTTSERVIMLENISFVRNSDIFNNEKSQGELFRIYRLLSENKDLKVEFFGRFSHTSKILAYLVRNKIDQERITINPPSQGMRNNVTVRFFK